MKFHGHESHEFGNYDFCKDYTLLKRLVDEGKRVITFRRHNGLSTFYRESEYRYRFFNREDIVSTADVWDFTPWDEFYIELYGPQRTFEQLCETHNVEFLIPKEQ